MAVVKNKTTPENRAFWDHVERVARDVRSDPQYWNFRQPEDEVPPEVALEGRRDLCGMTDEELHAEIQRRSKERKRQRAEDSKWLHKFWEMVEEAAKDKTIQIPDEYAQAIYLNMVNKDVDHVVQSWSQLTIICVKH